MVELLSLEDDALLAHCRVDTYRASGPGGQKRNKTDSAVRLRLKGTELMVVATESRSQHENRARALRRMRRAIALSRRRVVDVTQYEPSETVAGCLVGGTRLTVGLRDRRYLLVVAEVLDVLLACGMRLSDAAELLQISTGNLSAFVTGDPKLADQVNRMRREAGLKVLR
ncbi:MAG: peptide chain release factor-like protein [Phycisphaerae bacterium]